jgi:hypothetical protein
MLKELVEIWSGGVGWLCKLDKCQLDEDFRWKHYLEMEDILIDVWPAGQLSSSRSLPREVDLAAASIILQARPIGLVIHDPTKGAVDYVLIVPIRQCKNACAVWQSNS